MIEWLKRAIFGWKRNEVEEIVQILLSSTYDHQEVEKLLYSIDEFNAGAIDDELREHIFEQFEKMQESDQRLDQQRLENWRKRLGIK